MKLFVIFLTLILTHFSATSADIIQEQNFDAPVFKTGAESKPNHFNLTNDRGVIHRATYSRDLMFTHTGKTSITTGGVAGVIGGEFRIQHYSARFQGSKIYTSPNRTGTMIFQLIQLTGFKDKHFSMNIKHLGTPDDDDDVVVRLVLNKRKKITLLDTRSQNKGNVKNNTLAYAFDDTDTFAQLIIDIQTDGDGDGYAFDNIVFSKNGKTQPSSSQKNHQKHPATLFSIGGIRVILQEKK